MTPFRARHDKYREHGLDLVQSMNQAHIRGHLSPELIDALARFRDLLLVNTVMDGRPIRVQIEIPDELETAFRKALG